MAALRILLSMLMVPVTLMVTLFGIMGMLAGYIAPYTFTEFAVAGLLLPLTLLLDVILLIYWLIRKRWWILVTLGVLLLNLEFISSVLQLRFTSPDAPFSEEETIKIVSYNVRNFHAAHTSSTLSEISRLLQYEKTDIACFQEYCEEPDFAPPMSTAFPFLPVYAASYNHITSYARYGLAIFSRYPVLRMGEIDFHSLYNRGMWADLKINEDTVRVFNVHLQTTSVSRTRDDFARYRNQGNIEGQHSALQEMYDALKENFKIRASQAREIRQLIDTTLYPVILCGDFNDTPASYAYHTLRGDLKDGFKDCGTGYTYTFRGIRKLLRIDFVLYSPSFQGKRYYSPQTRWSDHNPVFMEIQLQPTKTL